MISNCMPFVHQPSIPFPYPYTIIRSTLCHFTPISLKSFQSALLHSSTNYFTLLHFTPPHITPNPIPSPHSSQLSLTPSVRHHPGGAGVRQRRKNGQRLLLGHLTDCVQRAHSSAGGGLGEGYRASSGSAGSVGLYSEPIIIPTQEESE